MTVKDDACTSPCKGIYADVVKNNEDLQAKKYFSQDLDKYKKYKLGFNDEGDLFLSYMHMRFLLLGFKRAMDRMIRIRFGTFTFEKIKKAAKANWIDKLSHIGGTAGLFNGFSFISVFEFLIFVIYIFINHCICFQRKGKESNMVNVQSNREKNQEAEDDIREKLDEMTEKCLAIQGEFNMTKCMAEEDDQKLRCMEGELGVHGYEMEAVEKKLSV